MRVERRSALGVPGQQNGSEAGGEVRSRRGSSIGLLMGEMGEVAASKKGKYGSLRSGLRRVSGQKGFL